MYLTNTTTGFWSLRCLRAERERAGRAFTRKLPGGSKKNDKDLVNSWKYLRVANCRLSLKLQLQAVLPKE